MKKREDEKWKKAVLYDFEKPTHSGFTEDIMQIIERQEQSVRPAPLISSKQWVFVGFMLGLITLLVFIAEYKWDLNFESIHKYSEKLITLLIEQSSMLWIALSLVTVFFVYLLFQDRKGHV